MVMEHSKLLAVMEGRRERGAGTPAAARWEDSYVFLR
jgi:hypothetical protein